MDPSAAFKQGPVTSPHQYQLTPPPAGYKKKTGTSRKTEAAANIGTRNQSAQASDAGYCTQRPRLKDRRKKSLFDTALKGITHQKKEDDKTEGKCMASTVGTNERSSFSASSSPSLLNQNRQQAIQKKSLPADNFNADKQKPFQPAPPLNRLSILQNYESADDLIDKLTRETDELMKRYCTDTHWQRFLSQSISMQNSLPHLDRFYGSRQNIPETIETINRDIKAVSSTLMRNILSHHFQSPMKNHLIGKRYIAINLQLIFKDSDLILVNKASKQLTAPIENYNQDTKEWNYIDQFNNTMANGLIQYSVDLAELPVCGLVNRLDYGTSGICIVAKNLATQSHLITTMDEKTKEYLCVVDGTGLNHKGTIYHPLPARFDPKVLQPATTHFQVLQQYNDHSLVAARIPTGRQNQIRIHLSQEAHPIVGDKKFNQNIINGEGYVCETNQAKRSQPIGKELANFDHVALHSYKLTFMHPRTCQKVIRHAKIPNDLFKLLKTLENDYSNASATSGNCVNVYKIEDLQGHTAVNLFSP